MLLFRSGFGVVACDYVYSMDIPNSKNVAVKAIFDDIF